MNHVFKLFVTFLVYGTLIVGVSAKAQSEQAKNMQAMCKTYQRPNIDCGCVSKRALAYVSNTESVATRQLLVQRYAYSLGLDNRLEEASKQAMSNPSEMISAQMKFDRLGGLPENLEDFEQGCVVSSSQLVSLSEPTPGSAAAKFLDARIRSVGESYRRESMCIVSRMRGYLSEAEIQAYHLSFSYYQGDHTNDDADSRAKKLGVSKSAYQALEQSARTKFKKNNERDSNYCNAITYAEQLPATIVNLDSTSEAVPTSRDLDDSARARMDNICTVNIGDQAICNCVIDKMQTNLSVDDFELVVDIRQAEHDGADDPLAAVAENRGWTRSQAQDKLGTNIGLIAGMMNMDVLACVGGMPDMTQFQELLDQ